MEAAVVTALLVLPIQGFSVAPASASPEAENLGYETMIMVTGTRSDYISLGVPRVYHPGNALITLHASRDRIYVRTNGGNRADYFTFEFEPAQGDVLREGLYEDATRAAFHQPSEPGLDVSGDHRGCNESTGWFDIKHFVPLDDGLAQLWITFEQYCDTGLSSSFGEIRFMMPDPSPKLVSGPRSLMFPKQDRGRPGDVAPVTFVAGSEPVTLRSASITGYGRAAFRVGANFCRNRRLKPGATCQVWVRALSPRPGPLSATLTLKDSQGGKHATSLHKFVWPGRSQLIVRTRTHTGRRRIYRYTTKKALIYASGEAQAVYGGAYGRSTFWIGFTAPQGDVLAPGRSYRAGSSETSAGLMFGGDYSYCQSDQGRFKVLKLGLSDSGAMRYFAARFVHRCASATPVRGLFEFRVPTDRRPPARPSDLSVTRIGTEATITWEQPKGARFTAVRFLQSALPPRISVNSGLDAYSGTKKSVTLRGLLPGIPLHVAAFSVDDAGNISNASTSLTP